MKWNNGLRFAFTPRVCDCGHTVWLEKYYYLGDRMTTEMAIPIYRCRECYNKNKK